MRLRRGALCLALGGVPGIATMSVADAQTALQPEGTPPAAEVAPRGSLPTKPKESDGFSFKLSGRMQADAVFIDEDRTPMDNGQELRRVYLTASGRIHGSWLYLLAVDFGASFGLNDAELNYVGFNDVQINLGYFKVPFSLDYQTSNNYTLFQERSLLHDAFDPPKRIGASVKIDKDWGGSALTAAVGVFGQTVPRDTPSDGDSGVGVAGRVTYAFMHTDTRLLHVGTGAERRDPGDGEVVQLRARPGAHLAPRLVDTGVIPDVDDHLKLGAEFAGVAGPFSLQGEYMTEQLHRQAGGDLDFDGWYAQAGYFLTNDSQATTYSGGDFGRVKPHGKYGAWQLALRYDTADLSDADFIGGTETDLTAGLNWYANTYMRMSMNYVKVRELDRPGSAHDDDKPDMLAARIWLYF